MADRVTGRPQGAPGTSPLRPGSGSSPLPPPPPPPPGAAPQARAKLGTDRLQTGPLPPKAADPLLSYPTDREAIVQEVLKDGPKGVVGEAVEYWREQRKQEGVMGYVAAGMEGLLELSGLPAVERSAQELGARVGAGAEGQGKAAAMLTFNCGLVLLNGLAGAKAVASGARAAGLAGGGAQAAKAAAPTLLRHYTSAEAAAAIQKSGVLMASKSGLAGGGKIYMVAEQGAEGGLNVLRRFNIGHTGTRSTAKAIEIDLQALPPHLKEKFTTEAFQGLLKLENFVTHAGDLKLAELGSAVRVVDAAEVAITLEQKLKAGYALTQVGQLATDAGHLTQGLLSSGGR